MKVQSFGSLEDLLDAALGASFGDPRESHEEAMERIIQKPHVASLTPATDRTVTKISPHVFHISSEGFDKEDPHALILMRNPMKEDRWRLYSICPRTRSGLTSYKMRGDEDTVIRQAQVMVDLALGIIKAADLDITEDGEDEHDEGHHAYGTETRRRGTEEGDT